jgi:hypothetical protein
LSLKGFKSMGCPNEGLYCGDGSFYNPSPA